jgi:hypothetical protein
MAGSPRSHGWMARAPPLDWASEENPLSPPKFSTLFASTLVSVNKFSLYENLGFLSSKVLTHAPGPKDLGLVIC